MRILCLIALVSLAACKPKTPARLPIPVSEDTTFLTGTFYLVRHAERYEGPDSTLTPEGHARAGALYHLLKDSAIKKVYITPYRRSIQTADSLRLLLPVDTSFYKPDTSGESLIYELTRHEDWGKHVVIIGHANTLIPIIRSLGAKSPVDSIGDKEFDRLFIIRKTHEGTTIKSTCY
ncbi:MAG: histidine phosphatase family protein [Chitinophaga sp.]|uniref:histidine phosphatase family protein n=1 Tax=Chitinophaga sp. TaxID=1869181 RepID=UPI0025C1C9B7|nr:histidine phosphatase family protein [Chitinophaga sp.]MBV8255346.1 histidine phosphatase family protein [Chitinophaga sp.]